MVAMCQKEDQKLLQCSQLGHQGQFQHVGISVQWQSSACNHGSVVRTIVGLSCQWQSDWATLEQGRHSVITVMWLPAWTIQWTSQSSSESRHLYTWLRLIMSRVSVSCRVQSGVYRYTVKTDDSWHWSGDETVLLELNKVIKCLSPTLSWKPMPEWGTEKALSWELLFLEKDSKSIVTSGWRVATRKLLNGQLSGANLKVLINDLWRSTIWSILM